MNTLGLPQDFLEAYGCPDLETYTTRVRSGEPDQVLDAAKNCMAPGTVAVDGDGRSFQDRRSLEKVRRRDRHQGQLACWASHWRMLRRLVPYPALRYY